MSDGPARSPHSIRIGLNSLNFFVAAAQVGFDPLLSLYLTGNGWNEREVDLTFSLSLMASLVSQVPAGFIVDLVANDRIVCIASLYVLGVSTLVLALWPSLTTVWAAQTLRGLTVALLTPAIASLTLDAYEFSRFGESLSNNARYVALGNAAAALIVLVTFQFSNRAILFLTAATTVPAMAALLLIPPRMRPRQSEGPPRRQTAERIAPWWNKWTVFFDLHLFRFSICVFLFTTANVALLPTTMHRLAAHHKALGLVTTGSLLVVQLVVALFAPWIGLAMERWGRRPLLQAAFLALVLRGLLFATNPGTYATIAIELLDGLSAVVMVMLIPQVAADLTRKTGFLSLAIGSFGLAAGLGALLSLTLADFTGLHVTVPRLTGLSFAACVLFFVSIPETRPASVEPL